MALIKPHHFSECGRYNIDTKRVTLPTSLPVSFTEDVSFKRCALIICAQSHTSEQTMSPTGLYVCLLVITVDTFMSVNAAELRCYLCVSVCLEHCRPRRLRTYQNSGHRLLRTRHAVSAQIVEKLSRHENTRKTEGASYTWS